MSNDPWSNQPDVGPYPTEGEKMRPTLRIDFGYVCEEVDYHTCGYSNPHEPDCGLIPICSIDGPELSDMERDLISALIKAQEALAEAERRGAERGWDEGWKVGVLREGTNPYRSQSPSEPATAPPEPVQPPGDHQDTTEPTGDAQ